MTAWLQQDFEAMDGRDADTMLPSLPVFCGDDDEPDPTA